MRPAAALVTRVRSGLSALGSVPQGVSNFLSGVGKGSRMDAASNSQNLSGSPFTAPPLLLPSSPAKGSNNMAMFLSKLKQPSSSSVRCRVQVTRDE
jgi:hypothetical protein